MMTPLWPKTIALVDMNAFFASIEQKDFPELRGKPVAVTNGNMGSTIITCSYEARAYGIKTGFKIKDALTLCPDLIQRGTRPHRYTDISKAIMEELKNQITPDIEVYSIDEAFLDLSHCRYLYESVESLGEKIRDVVVKVSDLNVSVGISGDKTTAKFAANFKKPNGLTIISPCDARDVLQDIPVKEIWGIGRGIEKLLASHNAFTCGDVAKLPVSVLSKRFGPLGTRIWLQCQGKDPSKVSSNIAPAKSLGHGKVLPPGSSEPQLILTYLCHMAEKVAHRLRKNNLCCHQFSMGFKTSHGWVGDKLITPSTINHSKPLIHFAKKIIHLLPPGVNVYQVQVTALKPMPIGVQQELFNGPEKQTEIDQAVDQINDRFGNLSLMPGNILKKTKMPDVIAPAWRPDGVRESIGTKNHPQGKLKKNSS